MNPLSSRTEKLLELAREDTPPPDEVRQRVERSLARRIALGAGIVGTGAAVTQSAAGAGMAALVKPLAIAGLGAVMAAAGWHASGWVVDSDPAPPAATPAPTEARATAAPATQRQASPAAEPPPADPAPARAEAEPERRSAAARSAAPARELAAPAEPSASDELRAETEALRQAQRALRDGDAARALALLAEQDARYPGGLMQQERAAARVMALCQSGRDDQARAAAERFERRFPRSPLVARVRSACQKP